MSVMGRGPDSRPSQDDRRKQQSADRMQDVNESTRPNQVNMADLQGRRR